MNLINKSKLVMKNTAFTLNLTKFDAKEINWVFFVILIFKQYYFGQLKSIVDEIN